MHNQVTFLHTSPVHVETFERLLKSADPAIVAKHIVAEDLLADAQVVGANDADLIQRVHQAITDAAANGAVIVACTCSTIGGAAERTPTNGRFKALRIDRAMADRAVRCGPNILVVAALASTLEPTTALIQESAAALQAEVVIRHLVVDGAWSHFTRGDQAAYIAAVASAVRAAPAGADVVVLAQASMAPAAALLYDLGVEVLSSPALGVNSIVSQLRNDG
jgi:pyruvate carboxylase